MKTLITIEEVAQFALSIFLFAKLPFAWWVYPALLLLPDVSMLGYLINAKVGAFSYNLFHHKALAIAVGVAGLVLQNKELTLAGILLFGHSSMDRMIGAGLKYTTGFADTHLSEAAVQTKPNTELSVA
jgi:hypothetical protein